jgi:hypothetical protein
VSYNAPTENSYEVRGRDLVAIERTVVCMIPPIKSDVTMEGKGFHIVVTVEYVRGVLEWSQT